MSNDAKAPVTESGEESPKAMSNDAKAPVTESGEESPKASKKLEDIITVIEKMSVLELSALVKLLEQKFGVSASAPMVVAGAPAAAGAAAASAPQAEEKTAFTLVLVSVGDKKINVIKEVRAITNLGLKEAKDLVESAPKPIKEGATKEESEKIKAQLEAVGAKIELK
jgi:large subunit ribosomal protein L7/L12